MFSLADRADYESNLFSISIIPSHGTGDNTRETRFQLLNLEVDDRFVYHLGVAGPMILSAKSLKLYPFYVC